MSNIDDGHTRRLGCAWFSIEYRGIVDEREILVVVVDHDVLLSVVCGWISHFEVGAGFVNIPSLTLIWRS